MAKKPFISVDGITVGEANALVNVILANGDITTNNITVSNNANLGNVGNVIITGGSSGYILSTNGSGNLSWVAQASGSSNISNGNSNVNIPAANGNVNISAVGNANVLVITGTGANITGTANISGNLTAGNIIAGSGSGGNITNANVISANTFTASGNITAGNANLGNAVTANYFIGSGANLTNIPAGNISGQVANALIAGTVYTNAQPNITSVGSLTGLTVSNASGTVNLSNTANVALGIVGNVHITGGSSGQYLQTDGSGTLSWATISVSSASISNGNSNVNIPSANGNVNISAVGNANVLVITGTGANITGTANITGNLIAGNIIAGTGSGGNISNANVISANTFTASGNITAGNANLGNAVTANYFIGNFYGTANSATTAGTVTTAAQPNITSVGTLSSLNVSGSGSFGANVNMNSFNITSLATPVASTDAATKQYVDDVAQGLNVHDAAAAATPTTLATITGGTITYNNGSSGVGANLTTTGSFNLIDGVNVQTSGTRILVKNEANAVHNGIYTWSNATVITRATDYNSVPEVEAGDFIFVTGGTLYDNTGWVQTSTVTAIGTAGNNIEFTQFSGAGTYQAGTGLTLTGSTFSVNASQTQITSVGTLTSLDVNGTVTAVAFTANTGVFTGNGNGLSSLVGANVTGQVGNALIAGTVYTNAQPNITSVGTLSSLAVTANITSGNANLGNNVSANFFTGNGIYLTGITATGLANGNSNISIPSANGNVNISAVGNANILVITGTGANITGTLNVSGNATIGNLSTSGSGGNLSNINVVSANTFTASANITAGNANLGNAVTANYFIGNLYGTANLATYATTANSVAGANVSGQVANALISGTVYTNAQPNITSVGTLSSLSVTGNITSGNLIGPLANGNSNVNIPAANGNINLTSVGNTTMVITGTGANITGTANITGNLTAANLTLTGNTIKAPMDVGGATTGRLTFISSVANGTVVQIASNTATDSISGLASWTKSDTGNATYAFLAVNGNGAYIETNKTGTGNIPTKFEVFIQGTNYLSVSNTGSNITGTLNATGNANVGNIGAAAGIFTTVAGSLTTAAQPNITSIGTLSSLSVTGNVTSGNATLGNLVTANFFTGNGSLLTGITVSAGNTIVNGNSNVFVTANGNVTTSVSGNANILIVTGTGVNVSGTLNATGNTTVGNLFSSGSGGNISNVNVISANTFVASGNITAGNINTTGSGGNIGNANVISANTFTASGNITASNANLGNAVTANFFIGSGANLTSIPGGNVSGQVANALVAGTVYTAAQPNITSVGTLTGITSTGTANLIGASNVSLGPIGNVKITGGSNGQYLQTDGSGTLTWSTVTSGSTSNISNGNSNVNIATANGNITMSAVGNANILIVTGTGVNIAGTLNATGNTTVGNLFSTGSGGNISNVNVISANTFVASGNITAGNINTTGSGGNIGNANVISANTFIASGNITAGNLIGILANGNSNVNIPAANGNVNISAVGNANVVVITGTGINVAGTLNANGNANVGNLGATGVIATTLGGSLTTAAQPNITSIGTLSSLSVIGNITSGNASLGNATTANFFIGSGNNLSNIQGANVTGAVGLATFATTANAVAGANVSGQVANALVAGTVYTNAQLNITSVGTLTGLTSTGTANFIGASNVSLGPVGNVKITGGSNGQYLQTDGSGTLTWATVATGSTSNISNGNSNVNIATANGNITMSAVGNANILIVTGTGVNVAGTLNTTGNVAFTGANVSLGPVGNVKITGGTADYVLKTDGSGNLSWTAQTPSATITVDNFTGNGVQTVFTLSTTPTGINQTSVNYNGATVLRTDYSLAGANITFSSAPANGSLIEVTTINLTSGGGGGTSSAAAVGYSLIFGG